MGSDAETDREVSPRILLQARSLARRDSSWGGVRPAPGIDPLDHFRNIAGRPYPVYLWGDRAAETGRYSIITHTPYATIRASGGRTLIERGRHRLLLPVDGVALAARLVAWGRNGSHSQLPFVGGAIGYVSYEHGRHYVGVPANGVQAPLPAYHFAFYDHAFVYDHQEETGFWVGDGERFGTKAMGVSEGAFRMGSWESSVSRDMYLRDVEKVLAHIAAGDIYQANYTVRFSAPAHVDPVAAALALQEQNPSPLGAFLGYPFGAIWSCSPELLLDGDANGRMMSRPIKGTRGRDPDPARDVALRESLAVSEKDRAELLMIVDLVRNDLGRVAEIGTVTVDTLFGVRTFANVHHLEATVSATLPVRPEWSAVMAAILPGGSVTGAPKRRAVEVLGTLETVPRSVYTGAIGYFSENGRASFNLPIRTAYHDGTHLHLHSGGGIVADSSPEREYDEMQTKIENMRAIFSGLCTST